MQIIVIAFFLGRVASKQFLIETGAVHFLLYCLYGLSKESCQKKLTQGVSENSILFQQ